jgi:general secretion pathway protein B
MSLILDALKKSEAERQRHVGPTLLDVRIPRPQRRYPAWAFVLGGLLLINMALLLLFVLRRPASQTPAAAVMNAVPAAPAAQIAAASAPSAIAPVTLPTQEPPQSTAPVGLQPSAPASRAGNAAFVPPTLADDAADDDSSNPADEEPALPRSTVQRPAASGSVRIQRDDSGGYSSLPNYSELGGNLPALRLDLHVYADRPRDRYAMINMQAVHEGDALSEGLRVLAITREGVALDYRGQQFLLHPQQ